MKILTPEEKSFLDVFLYEATTSPFRGPATEALHGIGLEYGDISHLAWAYEQDVPRMSFELGHAADVAPPLPWTSRTAGLRRDQEIERIWEENRKQRASENQAREGGASSGDAHAVSPSLPEPASHRRG